MMRYLSLLLLSLALLNGGCLLKPWLPAPDPAYSVENRFAILQTDSLIILVRPQVYSGDAQPVSSDYFNIYLRVRNISGRPIALAASNFSLIAGQRQYDYIPLPVVLGGIPTQYLSDPFEFDPFNPSANQSATGNLQQAREQYLELVNNYFSFGDILPGGVKEGYLFYDETVNRQKSFILDALGTRITFQR